MKRILKLYQKDRACSPMMLIFVAQYIGCWFSVLEDRGSLGVCIHKFDFVSGVPEKAQKHPYVLGLVGADDGKVGHWVPLPDELQMDHFIKQNERLAQIENDLESDGDEDRSEAPPSNEQSATDNLAPAV